MFRKPKNLHSFPQDCGDFSVVTGKDRLYTRFSTGLPVEKPVECVENARGHNTHYFHNYRVYVNFCSVIPRKVISLKIGALSSSFL
jgi:hypothetical protein